MDWELIVNIGTVWTASSIISGLAFGQFINVCKERDEAAWGSYGHNWRAGAAHPPVGFLRA